ncbi:hypothetical protein EI94DRAFT_1805430 [Lactarius quietus]|nr:hypothetical protein EI94DRAFT_1805430 [Lactarius quietus]
MSQLLAQLQGSSVEPYETPDAGRSPSDGLEAVPTYTDDSVEEANVPSEFFGQPEHHQGDVVESGLSDTTIDPIDADLTWQGMNPTFCDPDPDDALETGSNSSGINFASDDDFDSDDDDLDFSDHHPALEQSSNIQDTNSSLPDGELDCANPNEDDAAVAASAADLPEVIQRLWKQLLAGYAPSIYPPLNDSRGRELTSAEKLSLKHYIAWVDSCGTVKGYHLHAQVLQEATQIVTYRAMRSCDIRRTCKGARCLRRQAKNI